MSALLDYFDAAYIVNLPERHDRRRLAIEHLDSVGMRIEPGRLEFFDAVKPKDRGEFESIGARGCFESHLGIYRRALERGYSQVLVFEDDIAPLPELTQYEDVMIEQLQTDYQWGLVYFAYGGLAEDEQPATMTRAQPLRRSTAPLMCTHFYGIHRRLLEPLVPWLEQLLSRRAGDPAGGPMGIDAALMTYRRQHPELSVWLATRSLASQGSSRSDISPSWFDRLPVLRPIAGAARSALQRVRAARA